MKNVNGSYLKMHIGHSSYYNNNVSLEGNMHFERPNISPDDGTIIIALSIISPTQSGR